MVINPIIYAEVSVGYDAIEDLDDALPSLDYEREPLPYPASFLAGQAFLAYRRRGGTRRSPLPDLYIGRARGCLLIQAAAVCSYRLLTRDAAY